MLRLGHELQDIRKHAIDEDFHAGRIGMDAVGLVELGIERDAVSMKG